MKRAARYEVAPRQAARAKAMRSAMTDAERKLWRGLRQSVVLDKTHFRRQVPIAGFIADFCCLSDSLVVEVDGNQHGTDEAQAYDAQRTVLMQAHGYKVLRVSNHDVLRQLDSVLDMIAAHANPQEAAYA